MLIAPAVIELAFDPILRFGDAAVRWETLGVVLAVFVALIVAARIARRTPVDREADVAAGILGPGSRDHLRRDDLLFVVLGAIPGAVVGGRLGYALLHLDYYATSPGSLFDPASGSLELAGAIAGGALTASLVAAMLEAPVSRWFHVATLPLLVGIALGKGALIMGGSGQGIPTTLPWAVAFAGPGPWGSLAADIPAHPVQAYEAIGTLVVLLVMAVLLSSGTFDRRDGRAFAVAILLWSLARAGVATLWREPVVLGPLNRGHLIAFGLAAIALIAWLAAPRLTRHAERKTFVDEDELAPEWPDPATRPRF